MKKNTYQNIYEMQKKIRYVEEKIALNYKQSKMRCPTHLSIGQEAIAAASGLALKKNDLSISYHRSHAHFLAKGGNPKKLFAESTSRYSIYNQRSLSFRLILNATCPFE